MSASLPEFRSLLFVPAGDGRKVRSAFASPADAVILDLEDSVPPAFKDEARRSILDMALPPDGPMRMLRVNQANSPHFERDLAAAQNLKVAAIVLPKATPSAVHHAGSDGPPIVALVESAEGLQFSSELLRSPRVAVAMLGGVDLSVEMALETRADGLELLYARSKLVADSAAAGLRAPIDVVHLDVSSTDALRAEALLARSLGFGAKACIHPVQVPVVNDVFTPSESEILWARKVLKAYEAGAAKGHGAVAVDGQMVDLPLVLRAQRTLTKGNRG